MVQLGPSWRDVCTGSLIALAGALNIKLSDPSDEKQFRKEELS
jgi:hypothetical protein